MNHGKTTLLGILTIISALIGGVVAFLNGHLDSSAMTAVATGVGAGIGLIKAADADKV